MWLLDDASGAGWLQLNFTEGGFVLRDVLLEDVQKGFRLLRADINSLKIMYSDGVGTGLIDPAEHQQEVPQIDADLHAVSVIFPIFGRIDQLDLWRRWLTHRYSVTP